MQIVNLANGEKTQLSEIQEIPTLADTAPQLNYREDSSAARGDLYVAFFFHDNAKKGRHTKM